MHMMVRMKSRFIPVTGSGSKRRGETAKIVKLSKVSFLETLREKDERKLEDESKPTCQNCRIDQQISD